jgi:hypothetical protein
MEGQDDQGAKRQARPIPMASDGRQGCKRIGASVAARRTLFEMHAERDIISHGRTTMYALLPRAGQAGKGKDLSIGRIAVGTGRLTRRQMAPAPRPYAQTFSRAKSSRSDEDNEREGRDDRDGRLVEQLRADLENTSMPLEQRLEDMGIDPKEYKAYDTWDIP